MVSIGYFLSSEEFGPRELVRQAKWTEEAGFERVWISDHFHPWNGEQGQSSFVWSVIGALSEVTRLPITTAVTCPTVRIHPAIIAQAAATAAIQCEGRFTLDVGSGEALNEHIFGDAWPPAPVRLEMLEEAVEVIRALHTGHEVDHHGKHYTVENARLYTLPEQPVPIYASAFGPKEGRWPPGFEAISTASASTWTRLRRGVRAADRAWLGRVLRVLATGSRSAPAMRPTMVEGFDSRLVKVDEASIFTRFWGEGPPVLLLHGHPRTSATWHRVAPLMVDQSFTVVCLDLCGYGCSLGHVVVVDTPLTSSTVPLA